MMHWSRIRHAFHSINPVFLGVLALFIFTLVLVGLQVFQAVATPKTLSGIPQHGWTVCADLGYGEVPGAVPSYRFKLCHPSGWEVLTYCLDNSKPQPPIGTVCQLISEDRFWCGDDYQEIEQYDLLQTPTPTATATFTKTFTVTPTFTTSSTSTVTRTPTNTKTQGPSRTPTSTRTITPKPTKTKLPILTKTRPPLISPTLTVRVLKTTAWTSTSTSTQPPPSAETYTPTVTLEPSQTQEWEYTPTSTPVGTIEMDQTLTPTPTERPKLGGGGLAASVGGHLWVIWAVIVGFGGCLFALGRIKKWLFRQ
jgi:hypothetical protein